MLSGTRNTLRIGIVGALAASAALSAFVLRSTPQAPGKEPTDRATAAVRTYDYSDHVRWSQSPPGGLSPSQVPMFVQIGFDDNPRSGLASRPPEGMTWATDFFRNRRNPPGRGNTATFDGTPVRASFYCNTTYISDRPLEDPGLVRSSWRTALEDGHEIGNHTHSHPDGSALSAAEWQAEIETCDHWLTRPCTGEQAPVSGGSGLGASLAKIEGFRAPYLRYNEDTMAALVRLGFTYDISIEEGWQLSDDGRSFNWPYTLDEGSPGAAAAGRPVGSHPGLWELGAAPFAVPPDLRAELRVSKITGVDYNLFVSLGLTKAQAQLVLKYSLDQRLAGNRAPFFICAHTAIYTNALVLTNTTPQERREVIEEFVAYALSKPEVRIVTAKDIIAWMRNPVPLGVPSDAR